jgi:hypothetical protein
MIHLFIKTILHLRRRKERNIQIADQKIPWNGSRATAEGPGKRAAAGNLPAANDYMMVPVLL